MQDTTFSCLPNELKILILFYLGGFSLPDSKCVHKTAPVSKEFYYLTKHVRDLNRILYVQLDKNKKTQIYAKNEFGQYKSSAFLHNAKLASLPFRVFVVFKIDFNSETDVSNWIYSICKKLKSFKNVIFSSCTRFYFENSKLHPFQLVSWLTRIVSDLKYFASDRLEIISNSPKVTNRYGIVSYDKEKFPALFSPKILVIYVPKSVVVNMYNMNIDSEVFKNTQRLSVIKHEEGNTSIDFLIPGHFFQKFPSLQNFEYLGQMTGMTFLKILPIIPMSTPICFYLTHLCISSEILMIFNTLLNSDVKIKLFVKKLSFNLTLSSLKLISMFLHLTETTFKNDGELELEFYANDTHVLLTDIENLIRLNKKRFKDVKSLRIILYFREVVTKPYGNLQFAKKIILKLPELQSFILQEKYIIIQQNPVSLKQNCQDIFANLYDQTFQQELSNLNSKFEKMSFKVEDINYGIGIERRLLPNPN